MEAKDIAVAHDGKHVLRSVSIAIKPGEVLGVLGPSGAGKSTLFRALVGERVPDSGTVMLDGVDITKLPLWERARLGVGYVPQTPSVLWDLSVADNLATYVRLAGKSITREMLAERVDLTAQSSTLAGKLSGGERRRLELARALAIEPRVLICDEPFAGVDPALAERLGALLASLAKSGVAVVLADHHVEEALRICDRALLLLDGEIRAEGTPSEFREHELVRGRYLGTLHP